MVFRDHRKATATTAAFDKARQEMGRTLQGVEGMDSGAAGLLRPGCFALAAFDRIPEILLNNPQVRQVLKNPFRSRVEAGEADSTGRRNTPFLEVSMTTGRRKSERSTRHKLFSPGVLKSRNLTFAEREEIALECAWRSGVRTIAHKLGRVPSTISREIRRNSATRGGDFDYLALTAQWHADRAARLCAGSPRWPDCNARRHRVRWAGCSMEEATGCSSAKSTLVFDLERRANRATPEGGLSRGSNHAHQP